MYRYILRLAVLLAALTTPLSYADTAIPANTKLVIADQNEALQTLLKASGEQARLSSEVSYANFLGGPAILEAFRAGALDLAVVGNTPPIQAHAAGEKLPIIAVRTNSGPDYQLAVRPGLVLNSLKELKGRKIAYAEGTGRQPFMLSALKLAGLTKKDVTLVPLRAGDFPAAIRAGQVDVAALNEPHFSRYLRDFSAEKASALPESAHAGLPTNTSYLYASETALKDPARYAAIRQFVASWIKANDWSVKHPEQWVQAYYVKNQNLTQADGLAIIKAEGTTNYPLLSESIGPQQQLIDLIYDAGDLPGKLDAREEFDLRFDDIIRDAVSGLDAEKN